LEGSGHGVIEAIALRDWGKPQQTSVRMAGVPPDTGNRHLLNVNYECYNHTNPSGISASSVGNNGKEYIN
jgi:hypothetical protein